LLVEVVEEFMIPIHPIQMQEEKVVVLVDHMLVVVMVEWVTTRVRVQVSQLV
tara:strand:- start:111 stop:266 length:156 start_codon:yes stop_codon:yes gene_type:complete